MMADLIDDFFTALRVYLGVASFAKRHQIWRGFTKHRLVLWTVVVVTLLFGLTTWQTIWQWWSSFEAGSLVDTSIQTFSLIGDLAMTGYNFAFAGAYKYLVLIVMELLIFHVALRTNEIVTGEKEALTTELFFSAQIRMIKVSIYVFILEFIASILISMGLGVLGLTFLKPIILFLVQCYFLGFALIDNYNEINGMPIRASFAETKLYPGAALGIGLVLYILILIPMIGPFIGPMVGAVAATVTMHVITEEKSVREIMFEGASGET